MWLMDSQMAEYDKRNTARKKYHYIGITPYMPYDNNCMVRLMPPGMAGVIACNKNELTSFNASINDVIQYCGRLYVFTAHKHWAPFTPSPDVDFDGPMIKADRKIIASTTTTFDTPLAQMIREQTNILIDQLGVPSSIEQHDNMLVCSYDTKYIGETVTDIVSKPKKRTIDIRTHNIDPYVRVHFTEIGNIVTYKGTEYIYTGEPDGWIKLVERFKLNNKEEKNMVMDIRFIGKTSTALVEGSINSTVRIGIELVVAKVGNIVMYDNTLYMIVNNPKYERPVWVRISDKLFGNEVRYDKIPRNWMNIKNVVFNDPATIVFWNDGTKTVVKCGENDKFDPEKGLVMAIAKKAFGNQGNYFNKIKKWVPKQEEKENSKVLDQAGITKVTKEALNRRFGYPKTSWKNKRIEAIQELICDMTIKGATKAELTRAIMFSKDLIDSTKGADIDTNESAKKYDITELINKYQPKN